MMAFSRDKKLADIVRDEHGNPVYTGDLHRPGAGRTRFGVLLAALTAAVIGSGCIDAAGAANAFYVILPFLGEVIALFVLCWNGVKLLFPGDGLRTYAFNTVSRAIPGACRVLTVFALFGLAASGAYLMRSGFGGQHVKAVAYLVLKVLSAALAERTCRDFRAIPWEIVPAKKT